MVSKHSKAMQMEMQQWEQSMVPPGQLGFLPFLSDLPTLSFSKTSTFDRQNSNDSTSERTKASTTTFSSKKSRRRSDGQPPKVIFVSTMMLLVSAVVACS